MMRKSLMTKWLLVPALLLLAVAASAQGRELYRYTDENGNVVVGYQIPPGYVAGGYEVLNDEGVVIRVVPPAPTEAEQLAADDRERREAEARAEEERLRKWDESLLLRYSTVADIEAARDRALRDLRIRVSILQSNKRSLKQKVENYQAQAADLERSGKTVDVARLQAIEDLQAEIRSTDRAIGEREREIEEVAGAYQQDIERFEQLLDVVELRRSMIARDRE